MRSALLLLAGIAACDSREELVAGEQVHPDRRQNVELRASDADLTYTGAPAGSSLGWQVAGVGDIDEDGRGDVAASAPSWPTAVDGGLPGTGGRVWLLGAGPDAALTKGLGPPTWEGAEGDHLGYSLAPAGDIDRDGELEVAIGAIGRDRGAQDVGYVIVAGSRIRRFGREAQDFLGSGIAPGGDLDDDGFDEILVGAILADGPVRDAGQIRVYGGGPVRGRRDRVRGPEAVFAGTRPHDGLGDLSSFASADLDGDGWRDVAAAAWDFRGSPFHADVYVFANEGGFSGVIPLHDATARYTGESWLYGYTTVASAGDVDGDGLEDLLVGRSEPLGHKGAVTYVIRGTDPIVRRDRPLAEARHAELIGDEDDAWQGLAAGDLDGDGLTDVVVGAPDNDTLAAGGGAVSVFYGANLRGQIPVARADVRIFGDGEGDHAGHSVTTEDHDGDGIADLVIGGFGHADHSGAVWVFLGNGL